MSAPMSHIEKVWNTGDTQDWYPPGAPGGFESTTQLRELTGASAVVQLRWFFGGQAISCDFPAVVLPDLSGVVMQDEWHFQGQLKVEPEPYQKRLRVLNPDGSLRLRIFPPRIDEHSKPEESWIEEPRDFTERGIPFGAQPLMATTTWWWSTTGKLERCCVGSTQRLGSRDEVFV